jgi:hypothetical protein
MMVTQMHGLDRLEKGDDLCKGIKFSPQSFLVKPIPKAKQWFLCQSHQIIVCLKYISQAKNCKTYFLTSYDGVIINASSE